jgi:hypothetical protein
MIEASYLGGNANQFALVLKDMIHKINMLSFDTEQSKFHTQKYNVELWKW